MGQCAEESDKDDVRAEFGVQSRNVQQLVVEKEEVFYCPPQDLIRSGQNWSDPNHPIRSNQNFQIKFASYCQPNCSELTELISSARSKSNQILISF